MEENREMNPNIQITEKLTEIYFFKLILDLFLSALTFTNTIESINPI